MAFSSGALAAAPPWTQWGSGPVLMLVCMMILGMMGGLVSARAGKSAGQAVANVLGVLGFLAGAAAVVVLHLLGVLDPQRPFAVFATLVVGGGAGLGTVKRIAGARGDSPLTLGELVGFIVGWAVLFRLYVALFDRL
jgi:hypothetical protein